MQKLRNISLFLAVASAAAFQPLQSPRRCESALCLTPSQGIQLEAAYNAGCVQSDEEDECSYPYPAAQNTRPPLGAARDFVARIFSMPSALLHPKESNNVLANVKFDILHNDQDDVVLYPIVGFRLMPDGENHVRALPTVARSACRLPANQKEEIYGWFSAACPLEAFED